MITFSPFRHYMARWGRHFCLPTPYVHAQKASSLAPGYVRGSFSVRYLAISRIDAAESVWAEVGRRKRLPHSHTYPGAIVCGAGPRNRQSYVWTRLAGGSEDSTRCGRRHPLRRKWKAILSTAGLGDYAESCPPTAAAKSPAACDYALAERLHGAAGQSYSWPDRSLLGR